MPLSSRNPTGQQGSATTFQWVGPSSEQGYYGPPAPQPAPVAEPAPAPAVVPPAPRLSSRAPVTPDKSGEGQTLFSSAPPVQPVAPVPTPEAIQKNQLQRRESVAHTKEYLKGLNPFRDGLTGFVTDYTPLGPALLRRAKNIEAKTNLVKDHPEMASAIEGDGILGSLWKNGTQGITELGLDLTELANVLIPVNDYAKVKQVTNDARVRMGMAPEPEISSRSQAVAAAFDDTYQGVSGFLKDFRDSGVKVWKTSQIKDPIARRDAMGQWTQDVVDGIMGAGTLGVGTKLQNDQGFSSDTSAVYYKGEKIRDLTDGEKKIAGAGKTAGSVVGSMMVWKTLSPFAGRQVLSAMPQLTKFAVAHPFIFQVTAANLAEQGIQFAVAKTFNVPYTFADTVTSVIMQFGFESMNIGRAALSKGGVASYDPIGLRAEQAAKFSDLPTWAKEIDYEAARTQLDKVTEVFMQENGRTPTQIELQNLMGDVSVPVQKGAEPMTWNDLHEQSAKEWMARSRGEGENRLLPYKAGEEGIPGRDFPSQPQIDKTKFLDAWSKDPHVEIPLEGGGKMQTRGGRVFRWMSADAYEAALKSGQFDPSVPEPGQTQGRLYWSSDPELARQLAIPYGSDQVLVSANTDAVGKLFSDPHTQGGTQLSAYATDPVPFSNVQVLDAPARVQAPEVKTTPKTPDTSSTLPTSRLGEGARVQAELAAKADLESASRSADLSEPAPKKEVVVQEKNHETRLKELSPTDRRYIRDKGDGVAIIETSTAGIKRLQRLQEQGLVEIPAGQEKAGTVMAKITKEGESFAAMAKQDLPPEFAPTKAPSVENVYGQTFIKSTYDGSPITTNSYILELANIKSEPYLGKLRGEGTNLPESAVKTILDPAKAASVEVTPYAYRDLGVEVTTGRGDAASMFLRSQDGQLAKVDIDYLNYFKKKYGEDIGLFVQDGAEGLKPVTVRSAKGDLLGVIMPLRQDPRMAPPSPVRFASTEKPVASNLSSRIAAAESALRANASENGKSTAEIASVIRSVKKLAGEGTEKYAKQIETLSSRQGKAAESKGKASKINETVPPKAKEPVEPPKPPEAKKEATRLSSRKKPTKQPLPTEQTQPGRTSRLRDRLAKPTDAAIAEPSKANITKFLEEQFTAPIRMGKVKPGSLGTFFPRKNVVRLKTALDVGTAAHEVGHYIDSEFGLNKGFKDGNRYIEPFRSELLKMGEFTSKKSYTTHQKIKEGIAEFVRRYVEDPQSLPEMAPNFMQHFTKTLPAEAVRLLDQVRQAHEKLMAESPEYRVKSQISSEPPRENIGKRVQKAVDTVFSAIDDDLLGIRKFVKDAETSMSRETMYKEDPYVLARLTRGLDGKTLQWLAPNLKPFDGQGRILTDARSLGTILQDVGVRRSDFEAYLVSKRAIDLNAKDIETGILSRDAEAVVKTMDERHPDFVKLQKEIVGWNRNLLKYAQDRGFLSAEQVKNMTENGDNYVPFFRVIDEITSRGRSKAFADVASPFKKMKGSTRQIISPLESMTKNAYVIMSAVDRNRVGQAIVKLAQQHPDLGRWVEEIPAGARPIEINVEQVLKQLGLEDAAGSADEAITLFVRGSKPNVAGENIMMVVNDGKQKFYSVDPLLYSSMMSMNAENANVLIKALAAPASLLRAGATLTPEFMGRNPIRDQTTAFLYSRGGYIPGYDFAKGLMSTIERGAEYQRAAIGGAMQANFVATDRPALKRYVDGMFATRGEKAAGFFLHPLDGLRVLSEFGELGTRVGEASKVFAKEMAKHGDYEEALTKSAFSARNVTLDFGRRGWAGKTMNQIAAFWNANVQDITKFGRELSGREKGSNPGMTAMKAVAALTVPSIAFYEMSKNDPRYDELPRWQKDYFWIAALPGLPIIRIPKPFLPGLIFGSLPVRLLEAKDKGSLKPIQDFFVSLRENSIPGMMPTAMQPIIEYATNYSMFFGRQIVPQSQQSLLPPDQYGIYTAETYKEIGRALNLSPLKIESLVYGYTAGLGRYGTSAIDFLGAKTGLMDPRPPAPEDFTQLPVIRAFTISDLTNVGQTVSDFYDTYSKAESTYASLENAAGNKDVARAKELRDNNLQDLVYIAPDGTPQLLHEALGAVADTLSDLRQEREQTISSMTMGPVEKAQKILRINAAMRLVTGRAIEMTKRRPKSVDELKSLLTP